MMSNIADLCRLCAGSTEELGVSFLDPEHRNLLEEIVSSLHLEVNAENGFPTKICFNCLLVLSNWMVVKQKSQICHQRFCQTLGVPAADHSNNKAAEMTLLEPHVEIEEGLSFQPPDSDPPRGGDYRLSDQQEPVYCDYCCKSFDTPHKLRSHSLIHKLPHSCYVCKKRFRTKHKMLEHRSSSHEKRDFVCDFCQKRLSLKSSLSRHIVTTHFGFRNIECELCPQKFKTRFSYTSHLNSIHRHNRPVIKCELCCPDTFFKYTQELLKHFKRFHPHTTPYTCPTCGKNLSSKRNLIEHTQRMHSST